MMLMHRALRGGNPVAGDVTAPTLSSAVGTTLSATTATVGATTNEANGTLYVVVTTSATQPSIAQIKAGNDHTGSAAAFDDSQAISSTGAKTFTATGLTASTAYYAHLVHTDSSANDSNRLSSSLFTTDAGGAGTILFEDPLTSGTLAGTQNGVSWIDTANVEVEPGGMQFVFPVAGIPGNYNAEARLAFATPIVDLYVKFDAHIPTNYEHDSGNHKGFLLAWSNLHNYDGSGNFGYSQPDEILISQEMQSQGSGESQSFARIFGCGLDYNIGNNNWPGGLDWKNAIVAADRDTTPTFVIRCLAATTPGSTGNLNADAVDPQNGKLQIWKNGVLIMDFDTMNAYQPGHVGFHFCYIFGAANEGFGDLPLTITMTNFAVAEGNPGWV